MVTLNFYYILVIEKNNKKLTQSETSGLTSRHRT